MRSHLVLAATVALLLAAPAGTARAQVVAPPGNSGVDEYLEVVPGAGGDQPADRTYGAGGGGAASPAPELHGPVQVLGPAAATRLRRLGTDGRSTAQAAAAGAPRGSSRSLRGAAEAAAAGAPRGSSGSLRGAAPAEQPPGSPAGSVAGALGGSGGGLGLGFPLLLAGALAVAAVGLVTRRS